ncbi:O-antigen ligase family protein [Sedimenticola hydrogenitrophicus]|uniref:O-antigen ligase family protein n=1 Tax=Sedimenticola hydrogenitrophicus TaxID=2967975 RepID=UPI0021A380A7|nr:O-antigen ligase family protein [Sedimenticola hydrogenitrophicus]
MYSDLQGSIKQTSGIAGWFMRHALLLPVVVMASYHIGRGMGDSLQLLYLLCGLYALRNMHIGPHRRLVYLLVLLLGMMLLSALYPEFSARSLKYWVLYALSGLVLVFTVGASPPERQQPDYRLMAWIPIALLAGFTIKLGYLFFFAKSFDPATQINGMILAALSPLVFLVGRPEKYARVTIYALFYLTALLALSAADSRTELLMLLSGGAFFVAMYTRRLTALFIIIPFVLVVAIAADSYLFRSQGLTFSGDTFQWLDTLSSKRLSIWVGALSHPPENYLTGVGMHRSIEFLPELDYVKHLHNLFIEIWFETGLLGLLAYLALVSLLLSGLPRAYRMLQGMDRRVYAVFFASGMAALIGGLLDKGYLHPLTRYYMLFCFTVLYLYHRRCGKATAGD